MPIWSVQYANDCTVGRKREQTHCVLSAIQSEPDTRNESDSFIYPTLNEFGKATGVAKQFNYFWQPVTFAFSLTFHFYIVVRVAHRASRPFFPSRRVSPCNVFCISSETANELINCTRCKLKAF